MMFVCVCVCVCVCVFACVCVCGVVSRCAPIACLFLVYVLMALCLVMRSLLGFLLGCTAAVHLLSLPSVLSPSSKLPNLRFLIAYNNFDLLWGVFFFLSFWVLGFVWWQKERGGELRDKGRRNNQKGS